MLISFSVENFRSFKNEATLNLVATDKKEMRETHTFTPKIKNGVATFNLVRSAVVYGPNAGGKSNLFKALNTMENIVINSNKGFDNIPVNPFVLNEKTNKAPSVFEVQMLIGGIRYQYGFSATQERIHDEWLFAFPKGEQEIWFERDYSKKTKKYDYASNTALEGQKDVWEETTSSKALFLSTAVQLNSTQLQPIYDWFIKTVHFINAQSIPTVFSMKYCEEHGHEKIINFLKTADFAIEDIKIKQEEFSPKQLPKDMPESLANFLAGEMKGQKQFDATMNHKTEEGESFPMPLQWESDGTKRMFALAAPFLSHMAEGGILIIDELNQRLHPALMQFLISLFHNPKINTKNAQLIFTTHAVSMLKSDIFRHDQIWFCERERNQASTLFPLSDFKLPEGHEDFEAYYMTGRYGALPIIGDFSDVIQDDED